jgi:phosphoenolpyruvate mutase
MKYCGKPMQSRSAVLNGLIRSKKPEFLLEAHNALSAKIVEESGFRASGLSMSAALGLRDANEATSSEILQVLSFMAEITTVPILVDGDTGYGNFNNARRLVRNLELISVAGVCVEDKLFPKTNSFAGNRQSLEAIDLFCGKLKAIKDSARDDNFCVIARTEALIVGASMSEALARAEAYRVAGADAILIHSKLPSATEIIEFATEWADRAPLVVVPTTYISTPVETYSALGVSVVIWANHSLRAAISAMRAVGAQMRQMTDLASVESGIAQIKDVFELTGMPELLRDEQRYLPK